MSGGSRPLRPSAIRSSAVKAIPLFNSGELSTASPRALVSSQPCPLCRRIVAGASSGITLCRMAIPLPSTRALRAAPQGWRAARWITNALLKAPCSRTEGESPAQGHQSEQPDQRQIAGGGGERRLRYSRDRLYFGLRRRRRNHLGELHFFAGRLDSHDGRLLQLHYNSRVRQLGRLGHFDGHFDRREEDGHVSGLGQLDRFGLWIDEFIAPVSAGIEPATQSFRLTGRSFPECDHGLVGRL